MKFIRKRKNNKAAFSLIEMMTVIFIVAVGLVGTTQLIAQSLNAQMINKGGIVAYQLAQEGIEIVRQMRGSNWLTGADWREGLTSGSYCTDYRYPLTLRSASGINECALHLDSNNWYYAPTIVSESSFSGFRRMVEISDHDANSISVKATVTWNNRSKVISYEAETYLYNWY